MSDMAQGGTGGGRIVVGVDGSPESDLALQAAISEANRRGATLEVRSYWSYPALPGLVSFPNAEITEAAQQVLDKALRRVAELDSSVSASGDCREGSAASGLVEDSRGAELLVVGARGIGGFRGLRLGSVGSYCAQHARCPVLVMRAVESD
jgi:nucleotide-binding universal stress UspA family protein